jgi:hypothetical protein
MTSLLDVPVGCRPSAEAIPLYERTVADSERLLGDTHPDTLNSRNNLVYAYRAAGRLAEAEGSSWSDPGIMGPRVASQPTATAPAQQPRHPARRDYQTLP